MLPIPLTPADVTPAWLTAALRDHGLAVTVARVAEEPMHSLTSTLHRLRIEYDEASAGAPRSLIWKQSSIDSAVRAAFGHFRGSGYEREVTFYRDVAPGISTRLPVCYLARYDEETDEHVLLLEDLAATHDAGDLLHGMPVAYASALLRELALLHAARWDREERPDFEVVERTRSFFDECLADARPWLADAVGAGTLAALAGFSEKIVPWGLRLHARPTTVLHADTHPGNVMFPRSPTDRVALVDWQGWRAGPAARDLGRAVVLTLDIEDRRASERALIGEYVEVLRNLGVTYDAAEAYDDYRIGAANQWLWAVTFARREPVWDPPTREAMPGLARRAAAAALDALNSPPSA